MIRTVWFFLQGINFCDFQKVSDKSLITFSFLLSMCNRNTYFNNGTVSGASVKPSNHFVTEQKRQVVN